MRSTYSYIEQEDISSEKFSKILRNMMVSNFKKALQDTGAQEDRVIRDLNRWGKIFGIVGMGGPMRRKGIRGSTALGKAQSKNRCLNG